MCQIRSLAIFALFTIAAAPSLAAVSKTDGSSSAGPGCPIPGGICALPSVTPALTAAWDGPGCPIPGGICAVPNAELSQHAA